jgi:hypothetical protein
MTPHNLQHESYQYLKNSNGMYNPRTQRTALIAVENALLPPAAFITKSVNVRPIFEEPYDLAEIDRILAKRDLDIETILLLMEILGKLINHPDPEIALFAAESINAIENRYNQKIQSTKEDLEEDPEDKDLLRMLIQLYIELAQINRPRQVLRNFYLSEAYQYCKRLWRLGYPKADDYRRLTSIFLALGLYDQCRLVLNRAAELRPDLIVPLRILRLETAFARRDAREIGEMINIIDPDELDGETKELYAFWIGRLNNE